MKITPRKRSLVNLLAATALFGVLATGYGQAPAPTDSITNSFDNDGAQPHSWIYWYGWNPGNGPINWDATKDAQNNPNSGSLEFVIPMAGNNQQVSFGTFKNQGSYDGSGFTYNAVGFFTNIEFDILVDGSLSATNPTTGDFGPLFVELVGSGTPNGGGPFNDSVIIPAAASNGWVHLSVPVPNPPPAAFYSDPGVIGVVFKMDSFGNSTFRIGSTNHFWIDNVAVQFSGTPPPPPPPPSITSISKPHKNLNFYTSGSDYARSGIRAQGTDVGAQYQWYGVATPANPVNYSFNLTGVPGPGHAGAHFHIYLTPSPLVGTSGDLNVAPDYGAENSILMSLDLNTAGDTATYTFRSKTNAPSSNGDGAGNDFYASPKGSISDKPLGAWTLTFSNNINVTLTSPSGSKTNFDIDPNIAAYYNTPIYVYYGVNCDPGDSAKGFSYALSHIGITGTPDMIDASFTDGNPLDTVATWTYESANSGNPGSEVFVMPPEDENGYVIVWPQLNAGGFNLQTNSTLFSGWSTNELPAPVSLGVWHQTFLSTNNIDPRGTLFFRLANPGF